MWVFRSKSSPVSGDSPRGACKGYIFALEVAEELEQWPEQDTHGRQWVSNQPNPSSIVSKMPHHCSFVICFPLPELVQSSNSLLANRSQQVSPADAYRLCRYDWMREALSALLDRLAEAKPAAPELDGHGGVYMMVKAAAATADRAVALC